MGGEQGQGLLHYRVEGVAAVGFHHIEEDSLDLAQQHAAELKGLNGIPEARSLGIGSNGIYSLLLLLYPLLDCGKVVADLYLVVRRDSVGSVPFFKERIAVAGREHKK